MPKKITEQIKINSVFIYGKSRGLNNREAGRLYELLPIGEELLSLSQKALDNYVEVSKEPKCDFTQLRNDGTLTRSKLVMIYEKKRKAFVKIKEYRKLNPVDADKKISSIDNLGSFADPRNIVLAKFLSN